MASMLPNLRSELAIAQGDPPLEVVFRCGGGIELRTPADVVFRNVERGARVGGQENLQDLLRDLVAFKRAKRS